MQLMSFKMTLHSVVKHKLDNLMQDVQYGMPHVQYGMPHVQYGMPHVQYGMTHVQYSLPHVQYGMPHVQYSLPLPSASKMSFPAYFIPPRIELLPFTPKSNAFISIPKCINAVKVKIVSYLIELTSVGSVADPGL